MNSGSFLKACLLSHLGVLGIGHVSTLGFKLFSQPLIDLKLNIEWLGLPLLDGVLPNTMRISWYWW